MSAFTSHRSLGGNHIIITKMNLFTIGGLTKHALTTTLITIALIPLLLSTSNALSSSAVTPPTSSSHQTQPRRAFIVTGGNKGQGYALCERILSEYDDTHVFLASRNHTRGEDAVAQLQTKLRATRDRVEVLPLDVTDDESVSAAADYVRQRCHGGCVGDGEEGKEGGGLVLQGLVSNAGVLWGYSFPEVLDVCTVGVRRVLDAFLPLVESSGKIIVVSSGLGPLMYGFASSERQEKLRNASDWKTIEDIVNELITASDKDNDATTLETIGFGGGPFADTAPDFHTYGLAKMLADVYMVSLAKRHPRVSFYACDPGLVYTDLIQRIPRYTGKSHEEVPNAKTPFEGVEAAMRLLFDRYGDGDGKDRPSGAFYAVNKEGVLVHSDIDKRPDV
mmetsp:Transcript_21595/g.26736  ORF Transcript_21595/g.26736 Transcript_21595/m.26736 type:complete len:391 (+) Transcript_21595:12-1184(+)